MRVHRLSTLAVAAFLAGVSPGCGGGDAENLRIYHNPYGEVDWAQDERLKGQHHDHTGTNEARIRAYDEAGYDALSLMDYSGAPDRDFALKRRLWPVDAVLSADFLGTLTHVGIWFASAEEIGLEDHVTSSFLTTYVERWSGGTAKQPWQYSTLAELVDLISAGGGLPVLAHPWTEGQRYASLDLFGVEIYSAFAEARRFQGDADYVRVDRNRVLLENWDSALAVNQRLIGFAVNDHFGPLPSLPVPDSIRDSGKIIVLAKARTAESYREAIGRGAVLAVRDMGATKDSYPVVRSITVERDRVILDSDGEVSWIASGTRIGSGDTLLYTAIPSGSRYVRAEVRNQQDSVVFTQAFWVRPVGDADGDGIVTNADEQICVAVDQGTEQNSDRVAACNEP